MGKISDVLEKYCRNIDKQRELNDVLLADLEKTEWVEKMRNRSASLRSLTEDNVRITAEVSAMLEEKLSEEEYEELLKNAIDMYLRDYDDFAVLYPILHKLLEKYEGTDSYEDRIFLYMSISYERNEIYSRGSGEMHPYDELLVRIFSLEDHYPEFTYATRITMLSAYYNYVNIYMEDPSYDVNQSYERLKKAIVFWNSPMVQKLDGDKDDFINEFLRIQHHWFCGSIKKIKEASDEVKAFIRSYAEEYHQKELAEKKELADRDGCVYAAYLRMRAENGLITMENAVEEYLQYYKAILKKYEGMENPSSWDVKALINVPELLIQWLDDLTDADRKREIAYILVEGTGKSIFRDVRDLTPQFANLTLSKWCLTTLPYLLTAKEKEKWIFRLLVKKQLPTYLHSVMVSHLAKVYAEAVMEKKPSLFDSLPEEVRTDVVAFFVSCGLLHDVGKTQIANVINLQGRKLNDIEHEFIRRHPRYGYNFLMHDKDLTCYADVARGHHRFYDGSKGYPEDYDPSASPYRIAVDLIRICDTLDAATDHLGRNYKFTKNFQMIWEELKCDAGTSFNPELVALLDEAPELVEKLRFLCEEGREDLMYEAYKESIKTY